MTNEDPAASGPGGTPPRKSPRKGVGGSPVGSTVSIVLAVVAVVAGFLILRNITDDDDGASSTDGDGTEETTTTTIAAGLETTTLVPTTTVPPIVTEGATVVVANASGVPGSAGRMSTELGGAGFTMAEATNATSDQLEQSVVYYDPAVAAAQAVAGSVATMMGGLTVEAVPTPPPIEGGALNGSGVVVMLGTAQADKPLAELSTGTAATPETGTAPAVAGTETTIAPTTTAPG
jgi:LytR cell envelope-related transcriptional attenuator